MLAASFSACFTPVNEVECAKDSDCAPWSSCLERRCGARSADGGSGVVDAGSSTDAGSCTRTVPTSWGNIATELGGVSLGNGVTTNAELAHPLAVSKTGDPRIEVVNAQISRSSNRTESAYVSIRVKNAGQTGACFVRTRDLTYLTSSGDVVHVETLGAYVHGQAAKMNASQVVTDTCLQPGQEGFLNDIALETDVPEFFTRSTRVRLRFETSASEFTPLGGAFMPVSYAAVPAQFGKALSMVAINESAGQIVRDAVPFFAMLIPLDDEGRALPWAYLGPSTSAVVRLRACESVTLHADSYFFEGVTSRMYARTGAFEGCTGCLRAWDLSTDEGKAAFLARRNEVEAEKLSLVGR